MIWIFRSLLDSLQSLDISLLQRLSRLKPSSLPYSKTTYLTSPKAIAFVSSSLNNPPIQSLANANIYAEWLNYDLDLPVILYLHGGAYIVGSPALERSTIHQLCKFANACAFCPAYRLGPQNPFPCAVIDAVSAYLHLLSLGCNPSRIFFSGTSAGGGLAMATLLAIRDMKLPMPAGAMPISPYLDLTNSFPSFLYNHESDFLPHASEMVSEAYAPNRLKKHQYASPYWASDLSGLPPILLQTGSKEKLYDEDVAFAQKVAQQNPNLRVVLEVYEDQFHVFQLFSWLPTAKLALKRIGAFLKEIDSSANVNLPLQQRIDFMHDGDIRKSPIFSSMKAKL